MPLATTFEFHYVRQPYLPVRLTSPAWRTVLAQAVVDTGADLSLFDDSLADSLGIDLTNASYVRLRGIGGEQRAYLSEVELCPMDRPQLAVTLSIGFMQNVGANLGNLVGMDLLAVLDFGMSHANRTLYLGRSGTA